MTRRSRGLTLVEVMLAVLGLSLLLNVILASISANLRVERNADFRMEAIRLASSQLATAQTLPFDQLDGLSGTRQVEQGGRQLRMQTTVSSSGSPDLRKIVIVVTWKDGVRNLTYDTELVRSRL